jgi:hypothetical protein
MPQNWGRLVSPELKAGPKTNFVMADLRVDPAKKKKEKEKCWQKFKRH